MPGTARSHGLRALAGYHGMSVPTKATVRSQSPPASCGSGQGAEGAAGPTLEFVKPLAPARP